MGRRLGSLFNLPVLALLLPIVVVGCTADIGSATSSAPSATPTPSSAVPQTVAPSTGATNDAGVSPSASATNLPTQMPPSTAQSAPASTPSAPPTSPPSPTASEPVATSTPIGPALTWSELGWLGGPDSVHDDSEIRDVIGFDGGYLASQQIVGSQGQWATRLWSSADGREWRKVDAFDEEDEVWSMASDGRTVVALVRTLDYRPAAWVSTDGLNWRVNEDIAPDGQGDSPSARAVWAQPDGWHAALYEQVQEGCDSPYGCYRSALYESSNGLDWVRVGTINDGDPSAGMTLPDGSVLVDSDFLMASSDGGHSWRRERTPRNCYHGYSPIFLASAGTADLPLIYGGESNVCLAAAGLNGWDSIELPTEATLERFRLELAETPFGILASAIRDCFENPCPPTIEHFQSSDGATWSSLPGPTGDLEQASELAFANGPSGVIGLATFFSNGRQIRAFELVEVEP